MVFKLYNTSHVLKEPSTHKRTFSAPPTIHLSILPAGTGPIELSLHVVLGTIFRHLCVQ